ncbi:hypothetical protein MCC_03190 [Rickettsia rhipicephali str. 3-7-female6-CWPP]|uniref:Uncharacterized protein n=1 Tax=Rickettsia rhipicephali (strain 3-7-female6-CWPP) TaxID=1105113 RepID=A0AAI8A9T0_RICR3|nr:hypothetical protein MCC_03190 [Rickettsia rhipicephali str. 3-7-female6-CWPP]
MIDQGWRLLFQISRLNRYVTILINKYYFWIVIMGRYGNFTNAMAHGSAIQLTKLFKKVVWPFPEEAERI